MKSLQPTSLQPNERVASVNDLLTLDDRRRATIRVEEWRDRNGKAIVLNVHSVSVEEADAIRFAARAAVTEKHRKLGIQLNHTVFLCESLRFMLAEPRLTAEQAREMRHRNPEVVEMIVNFGWALSKLDQETIDAIVEGEARREAGAEAAAEFDREEEAAHVDDNSGDLGSAGAALSGDPSAE